MTKLSSSFAVNDAGTGTITEYTPGTSFVFNTDSGEPVHYKFSKSVTYVTPEGKVIAATKMCKDST